MQVQVTKIETEIPDDVAAIYEVELECSIGHIRRRFEFSHKAFGKLTEEQRIQFVESAALDHLRAQVSGGGQGV